MRHLTLLFLLASSAPLFSQDVQLYFGTNNHLRAEQVAVRHYETRQLQIFQPTDTVLYYPWFNFTNTIKRNYQPLPGFSMGANVDWKLTEKLALRTGLGLVSTGFRIESSSNVQIGSPTGRVDTVTVSPFVPGVPSTPVCVFTNSFPPSSTYDGRPRYIMMGLELPVQLRVDVTKRWGAHLGGTLRTPVASSRQQERVGVEMEESTGDTRCTYVIEELVDNTGSDLSDLTVQAEAGVQFWLDEVGLSLTGGKMLTNLFNSASALTSSTPELQAAPFYVSFKILYRLDRADDE